MESLRSVLILQQLQLHQTLDVRIAAGLSTALESEPPGFETVLLLGVCDKGTLMISSGQLQKGTNDRKRVLQNWATQFRRRHKDECGDHPVEVLVRSADWAHITQDMVTLRDAIKKTHPTILTLDDLMTVTTGTENYPSQ